MFRLCAGKGKIKVMKVSWNTWNTNNLPRCLQNVALMGTGPCSSWGGGGWGGAAVTGTCWTLFAFWRHHRATPPLFSSPVRNPPWRGFWVPRTSDWTLRVRCCLCASHRPCKRQNQRRIFKPDQIGAFEYNDPADM